MRQPDDACRGRDDGERNPVRDRDLLERAAGVVRADDAVWRVILRRVDRAALVGAHKAFVEQGPDEHAAAIGGGSHRVPMIRQAR